MRCVWGGVGERVLNPSWRPRDHRDQHVSGEQGVSHGGPAPCSLRAEGQPEEAEDGPEARQLGERARAHPQPLNLVHVTTPAGTPSRMGAIAWGPPKAEAKRLWGARHPVQCLDEKVESWDLARPPPPLLTTAGVEVTRCP